MKDDEISTKASQDSGAIREQINEKSSPRGKTNSPMWDNSVGWDDEMVGWFKDSGTIPVRTVIFDLSGPYHKYEYEGSIYHVYGEINDKVRRFLKAEF